MRRGALVVGIAVAAITLAAALIAWWRWERIEVLPGGLPLPPSTVVIDIQRPNDERSSCVIVCSAQLEADEVAAFYNEALADRGWEPLRAEEERLKFRRGGTVLRIVLHAHPRHTDFTIGISPCPEALLRRPPSGEE